MGAPEQAPLHFISYFETQKLAVVPTELLKGTGIKFVGQLALLTIVISDEGGGWTPHCATLHHTATRRYGTIHFVQVC